MEFIAYAVVFLFGLVVGWFWFDNSDQLDEYVPFGSFVFLTDTVDEKFLAYSFPECSFLFQADSGEKMTEMVQEKFPGYQYYLGLPMQVFDMLQGKELDESV